MFSRNTLFYGDNLPWLRDTMRFPDASIDLIYLDPPFNSNRSYNVLFHDKTGKESAAQIRAFDDMWEWREDASTLFRELTEHGMTPGIVADTLMALKRIIGPNDLLAYLTMMTARLVELHRILKATGNLFLHCDPTASHYLKIILDAIFGKEQFRNEIIWQRADPKGHASTRFPSTHDVILFYGKTSKTTWNPLFAPHSDAYLKSHGANIEASTGRRYTLGDVTNPNPDRPNLTSIFACGASPELVCRPFTMRACWSIPRPVCRVRSDMLTS